MRILMIGDIVGRPCRRAVASILPKLRQELDIDLAIANEENAGGGFGITPETTQELIQSGLCNSIAFEEK